MVVVFNKLVWMSDSGGESGHLSMHNSHVSLTVCRRVYYCFVNFYFFCSRLKTFSTLVTVFAARAGGRQPANPSNKSALQKVLSTYVSANKSALTVAAFSKKLLTSPDVFCVNNFCRPT